MTASSLVFAEPAPIAGNFDALAEAFAAITLAAGAAVLSVYHKDFSVRRKADMSPVCDADLDSETIILAALKKLVPDIPVLAEEAASRGEVPACGACFILVDPLDGTREFVSRNGEFTVNIALISDAKPRCGAVYAPALGKLWFGGGVAYVCEAGAGGKMPPRAAWTKLRTRPSPADELVALASRSHCDVATNRFLARLPVRERRSAGSSLKFCAIAEAEADLYPRFGPTMEWDTAAGDAVLRAAGGTVVTRDGYPLPYGKAETGFKNPAFVAWGDPLAAARSKLDPAGETTD